MLIAIDTATRVMSMALHDGENLLAEQNWYTPNRYTEEIGPGLQHMLTICEVNMEDIVGVGVAVGPGSYTGVRIGVSFAKGLAATRNLPLVGISTLDVIAAGQPYYQSGVGLVAVVPAGRGRIIVKSYRWRKGQWTSRAEPRLLEWEDLFETIDGAACITGEVNRDGIEAIREAQENGLDIRLAPAANRMRRAGYLAEMAWEQLHAAGGDLQQFAAKKLLPTYMKA